MVEDRQQLHHRRLTAVRQQPGRLPVAVAATQLREKPLGEVAPPGPDDEPDQPRPIHRAGSGGRRDQSIDVNAGLDQVGPGEGADARGRGGYPGQEPASVPGGDGGDESQLVPVPAQPGQPVQQLVEGGRAPLVPTQPSQAGDPSPVGVLVELLQEVVESRYRHAAIVA